MAQLTIPTDVLIQGNLSAKSISIPASSVGDAQIPSSAGIQATKVIQQYAPQYADPAATTVASVRKTIHVAYGATGTIVAFRAGMVTPCVSPDTVTVKLRKNGTDILSADISLSSSQSAFQTVLASGFTSTAYVAGDVFEVDITANHSSGTLGLGLFAQLVIDETPV